MTDDEKKLFDDLVKRVRELESEAWQNRKIYTPYPGLPGVFPQPINPEPWPTLPNPNGTTPRCSVCGMVFNGPMGYVCSNPICPSGHCTCQK